MKKERSMLNATKKNGTGKIKTNHHNCWVFIKASAYKMADKINKAQLILFIAEENTLYSFY